MAGSELSTADADNVDAYGGAAEPTPFCCTRAEAPCSNSSSSSISIANNSNKIDFRKEDDDDFYDAEERGKVSREYSREISIAVNPRR